MTDPALDAASYYRDFTVLKVHFIFLAFVQSLSCLSFHCLPLGLQVTVKLKVIWYVVPDLAVVEALLGNLLKMSRLVIILQFKLLSSKFPLLANS